MTIEDLHNKLEDYMKKGLGKNHVQIAIKGDVAGYIQPATAIKHSFVGKNMDKHKVFLVPTDNIYKE